MMSSIMLLEYRDKRLEGSPRQSNITYYCSCRFCLSMGMYRHRLTIYQAVTFFDP